MAIGNITINVRNYSSTNSNKIKKKYSYLPTAFLLSKI